MVGRAWLRPRLAWSEGFELSASPRALPAISLGLVLALGGQYLFWRKTDLVLALVLFAAAGFFLAWQWSVPEAPAPSKIEAVVPRLRGWLLLLPLALVPPAFGLASVLAKTTTLATGWVGGIVLLVVVAWAADWSGRPRAPTLRWPRWRPGRESLAVAALLLVSFLVRVWEYDTVPWSVMVDDAEIAIRGRDLLDGRWTSPFATGFFRIPEFNNFYLAPFFFYEIDPILNFQLAGVIPGTISIGLLYVLARQAYAFPVALTIAAIFALNRWWVLLSRLGNDFALQMFLTLAAVWLTWRGLRSGRIIWFVLLGIVAGVALIYLYLATIGPILAFTLWLLFRQRSPLSSRTSFLGLVIAGAVALAVALPRLYVIATEPGTLQHWLRYGQASGAGDPGSYPQPYHFFWTVLGLSYRSLSRTTLMFEDPAGPLLDPVSGYLAMLALGFLAYCAWRRQPWAAFWLVFYLLGMAIAASSSHKEAYNYRNQMILPAAAVGGGLALIALAHGLTSLRTRLRGLGWPIVALAVGLIAASTYQDFFVAFKTRENVWKHSLPNEVAAGRWLSDRADTLRQRLVVTTVEIANFATFQLSAPRGYTRKGNFPFTVLTDETGFPWAQEIPPGVETVNLLASPPPWLEWNAAWAQTAAPLYYPEATVERFEASNGRPTLTVFEWPRAAIESRQGLRRDPDATCAGGDPAVKGGWRGLVFVPERGRYRIRIDNTPSCANLGLRRYDATRQETYLARGWHEIQIVTPEGTRPELAIEREGKASLVLPHQLYAGPFQPLGFEVLLSQAPGQPPFERRYLSNLDVHWAANPPVEGTTFYLEARATIRVEEPGDYHLQLIVNGPTVALLDGAEVLRSDSREHRGLSEKRTLAAGDHQLLVRYHAQNLNGTGARFFKDRAELRRLDVMQLGRP